MTLSFPTVIISVMNNALNFLTLTSNYFMPLVLKLSTTYRIYPMKLCQILSIQDYIRSKLICTDSLLWHLCLQDCKTIESWLTTITKSLRKGLWNATPRAHFSISQQCHYFRNQSPNKMRYHYFEIWWCVNNLPKNVDHKLKKVNTFPLTIMFIYSKHTLKPRLGTEWCFPRQ